MIFVVFVVSIVSVSLVAAASVWDGVYTEEQAKRGETIYYERCAVCHGAQLEGGDMTLTLVGGLFTSTWNDLPLLICSSGSVSLCRSTSRARCHVSRPLTGPRFSSSRTSGPPDRRNFRESSSR